MLVPLVYERQEGVWIPLLGPAGYHVTEMDAARALHVEWLRFWKQMVRLTRQVRALCEHPAFATFVGDGIDADTIMDSVELLARMGENADVNIERLFDEPGDDDVIRIGNAMYRRDPKTDLLMRSRELEESELAQSPDAIFLQGIYQAVHNASARTGRAITMRGFEHAIDTLILMLPESEDRPDERGPEEFIADHRFMRSIVVAARRAFERTGRRVSVRGMQDAIAALAQAVRNRRDDEPRKDGEEDEPSVRHKPSVDGGSTGKHEAEPSDRDDDEPGDDGSNRSGGNGSSA